MEKYQFNGTERSTLEGLMIPLGVYQFIDNRVITVLLSRGFMELFGYTDPKQAYYDMDNNMYRDTHPEDAARAADAAFFFATADVPLDVVYRVKKSDRGDYRIIHAKGEHVYTPEGIRLAYVWYTDEGNFSQERAVEGAGLERDMAEGLLRENDTRISRYDNLSGLPSMSYFFELAVTHRESMLRIGQYPASLFINLSRLRYYNRKHGFSEGDRLLSDFSRLLAEIFGNEYCSRFGADHFAVITNDEKLEERLKKLFEKAKELNDGLSLPVHVGIHLQRLEDVNTGMAFDRAKHACDSLHGKFASAFRYYDVSISVMEEKQQYIIANLDRAIKEGWIKAYFQPIVRAVNGKVCDEEALVRWEDPVHGFMMPSEFIPVLEDSGLIYKLDLHMVDLVLEKLKTQKENDLHIVPQSVNLSRSDFDSCDIVNEICKRVDEAGFDHSILTIEITESVIGDDFEFMKEQVDRFHRLGFSVWMDDFGSGYSSLDVLSEVDFDLIKFDMHFLRDFDKNESTKIILNRLIDMATSLGMVTVCEGVETIEQIRFLRETGCSKLQGYYYQKPIPMEGILKKYERGDQIGFENPNESGYYEAIGRLSLHDLDMISREEGGGLSSFFNTTPMAILEIRRGRVRFLRNNPSYRDFMTKYMDMEISEVDPQYSSIPKNAAASYIHAARRVEEGESRCFIDEQLPDGTNVHYFVKKIAENPLKKSVAVAIAILSVIDQKQGATYAGIARALAADYFSLFYVDLETEKFIGYRSAVGKENLTDERHGDDFFARCMNDAKLNLHPDDYEMFKESFSKENILDAFREQGVFTMTYRIIEDGRYEYVNMKVMRMMNDLRHIIIGVSNIDAQMKQKEMVERVKRERIFNERMKALSGNYIGMYIVDPATGSFAEYSASEIYEGLGIEKTGDDFFGTSKKNSETTVAPEYLDFFQMNFTKDNVLKEIKNKGIFSLSYYLVLGGERVYTCTRAALVKEDGKEKLIVGVSSQNRDTRGQNPAQ